MGSLQDALLKTGLAKEDRKRRQKPGSPGGRPEGSKRRDTDRKVRGSGKRSGSGRPRSAGNRGAGSGASDLERAWAARRKAERAEKEREKQARVADQEARRKRNLELDKLVDGRVLNVSDAELPRYFEHLGRIRRVLCTPAQREEINRGELGIVNLRGRYLIVATDVLERYRALADDLVPDLSATEPEAEAEQDGEYPPVPDDIAW